MNSQSPKGFSFSAIDSHNLERCFVNSSESFLQLAKHLPDSKRMLQMFNFVHSCLTISFIKLKGVLSCVMALKIIFFHYYNRILEDETDHTLVMLDNMIFRAPFTVRRLFLQYKFFVSWLPIFHSPRNHHKNSNLLLRN